MSSQFSLDHLTLQNQHALKTMVLFQSITEEVLRQIIIEFPDLKHLSFRMSGEPITEQTVNQLLEMKRLKKLCCHNVNSEFVESLANIGNVNIEKLGLWANFEERSSQLGQAISERPKT